MKDETKRSLKQFFLELLVYAGVVCVYFFLVLHLLGDWLVRLFDNDRRWYAAVALLLIVGQGIVLELLSRSLMSFVKTRPRQRR